MAGAGWSNPFPVVFGGAPTSTERVYDALRGAVGIGGAARDEDSLEAIWRQCKARAIAAGLSFDERAALQAFPHLATDALPYYERSLLDRQRDPEDTDQDRRVRLAAKWTDERGGSHSDILAGLTAIDSRFSVLSVSDADTTTTVLGRAYEDLAGTEPFGGGRKATLFPNYSTHFVLTAVLALGGGSLGPAERRLIAEAQDFLADNLTAWDGIQVAVDADGFELDVDVLDYTLLTGG